MPRKARIYLPGVPAHVVQCGNNRSAWKPTRSALRWSTKKQHLNRQGAKDAKKIKMLW